jgi:hypothetical protein
VDGCALLRGDGGDRAVEQRDQRGIAPAHHDLQREVDVGDPDELDPPWREALDLLVQHRQDVDGGVGPAGRDRLQGRARVVHQHEVDLRRAGLQQVVGAVVPAHRDAPPSKRRGTGEQSGVGRAGDGDGIALVGVGEQREALPVRGPRGGGVEVDVAPVHGRQDVAEGLPFGAGLAQAELVADQRPVVIGDARGRAVAVAVGEVEGHPGRGMGAANYRRVQVGPLLGVESDVAGGCLPGEPTAPDPLLLGMRHLRVGLVQDRGQRGQAPTDAPFMPQVDAPAGRSAPACRAAAGRRPPGMVGLATSQARSSWLRSSGACMPPSATEASQR